MQIEVDHKGKELKEHGNYEFPLVVSYESLSQYDSGSFIWHWHDEIELTFIIKGKIEYIVNDTKYLLEEGQGLFGNSNTLHMGKMYEKEECEYISITFHPKLLYGYEGSIIKTKYVETIINSGIESIKFTNGCLWQKEILEEIKSIHKLYNDKNIMMEIKITNSIYKIWTNIYENNIHKILELSKYKVKDMDRLKKIIVFINDNYNKKITLDDIAAQINICRSECCRFFKKHMKESLFDYLLNYRIIRSLELLKDSDLNITEIAYAVGFSNTAYYSKIFKRVMECSPRAYKKKYEEN